MIVSSPSRNFYRCAGCFQSYINISHAGVLKNYRRKYHSLLKIMHQSISSSCAQPPFPLPRATAGHLLALSVPGMGHLQIFRSSRGPGICQHRDQPRAFDTHAVSYQDITTQRILPEKQADWLISQGRQKICHARQNKCSMPVGQPRRGAGRSCN